MRTGAGFSTEALYIFHNMVRKLRTQQKPEYLAAIFESEGPTFRDEVFKAYKSTRTETPPDLLEQIPWIRKIPTPCGSRCWSTPSLKPTK